MFKALLSFPYFSLAESFCTKPTEVPAITVKVPWPMEYKRSKRVPHKILPLPATIAKSATSTGVEQGEEKTPPSIPAKNAPIKPRFLFFETK